MKITCPECGFGREVPDHKIPSTAQRATCPKCGVKFSFRKPEPEFLLEDEPENPDTPDVSAACDAMRQPEAEEPLVPPRSADRASEPDEPETMRPDEPGYLEEAGEPENTIDSESGAIRSEKGLSRFTRGLDPEDVSARPDPEEGPGLSNIQEKSEPGRAEPDPAGDDIWRKLESMDIADDAAAEHPRSAMKSRKPVWADPSEEPSGARERRRRPVDMDEPEESGAPDPLPFVDVPWERLDRFGFFNGLFQTIKRAMFSPWLFFQTMPIRGGMLRPLAFYMLIYLFETLCQYVWDMAGFSTSGLFTGPDMVTEESFLPANVEAQLLLFVYPVLFAALLFAGAGINHLFLLAVQAGKAGFEGTFRALAYCSAPMVLSVIPVVGPLVGALWSFGITFIAFKYVHKTTSLRVVIAFLLPLLILVGMSLLVAVGANHSV